MSRTEKMKYHVKKASHKVLKTEENFTGFDVQDNLLLTIENKKNRIINICSHEEDECVEVYTQTNSSSIVNKNNVDEKSQSKSCVSTPGSMRNRSVNRAKNDHVESEAIESVDTVNVLPSLELTTPTFDLTSFTPSTNCYSGRKPTDVTDPIFKLPFEFGWKREVVYRNTKKNRSVDVYYYSPNNRKLRSLREIYEHLLLNEANQLTLKSFTFSSLCIGINDESKELIRNANTKGSKRKNVTNRLPDAKVIKQSPCGTHCLNSQIPVFLLCTQCLQHYHSACVKMNSNLSITNFICNNCR